MIVTRISVVVELQVYNLYYIVQDMYLVVILELLGDISLNPVVLLYGI